MSEVDWQIAPARDQFAPERQAVGQIAVMGDREAARVEFGEQRLDVAQDRRAGRGIADMADRRRARQALDRRGVGKMIADQAQPPLGIEALAVESDDARRFLAAMLEGVEAERGDRSGVGMAEDAEHPAFLAQAILVGIEELAVRRATSRFGGLPRRAGGGGLLVDQRIELLLVAAGLRRVGLARRRGGRRGGRGRGRGK